MFTIAPESIDNLIGNRLPAWMKNAPADRLSALQLAMMQQDRRQDQLKARYGAVTPLDVFAEILLISALQAVTGKVHDVRKGQLHRVWRKLNAPVTPTLPLPWERSESTRSLLASALHNFAVNEVAEELWLPESRLDDGSGATLPLRPGAYAALCRSLDIGGKYQAYLESHFLPSNVLERQAIDQMLEQVQQSNFEVAVRLAALKFEIDELTFLQLLPLISAEPIVPVYSVDIRPCKLYLLGKQIVGVVALEIRSGRSRNATLEGVVAWVPDDPHGELARYPSWSALYEELGLRLRQNDYGTFFMRFLSEADRPAFFAVLAGLQSTTAMNALQLDGRNQAITLSLFSHMRQAHIEKIIADARLLAVPTEVEDMATREARLHSYANAGLDLLTLASLFVPGLGVVMLGIAAAQLFDEVYEGYEDWKLGDRQSALGHLFAVAGMLGAGVVFAAGGAAVSRLIERIPFVDALLPVLPEDGRLRLCDGSLQGYRIADDQSPVAQVMGELGQQRIKLQQGSFLVEPTGTEGEWRIRHPRRANAHGPLLRNNGSGGWYHEFEQAHVWDDQQVMLSRLGSLLADVSDIEATDILGTTGFDRDRLRRLHVEGAKAPSRLLDALERHRLHAAEPMLRAEAFEQRIAARQKLGTAAEQLLRRDFPDLTARSAEMIVESASGFQYEQMLRKGRVPLPLAEQARWALRDSRLDRACAGLYQKSAVNSDCETLMVRLVDHLTPWSEQVRIELREQAVDGPLLVRQGDERANEVRRITRTEDGYQAVDDKGQGLAGTLPGDSLAQALLCHMDAVQKLQLGSVEPTALQLTDACIRWLGSNREQAAKLIGMVPPSAGLRPPLRLGDGRLGYPLSGRQLGARHGVRHGVRNLYPTLTDAQLEDFISQWVNSGRSPWEHLADLQQQLASLRQALEDWCREAGSVTRRYRRHQLAKQLRRVWRRKLQDADGVFVLTVDGEAVGGLPTLPENVRFDHVRRLTLRGMQLDTIDSAFMQRFSGLRLLDLGRNALTAIPPGIERLTELADLCLSGNRIVVDAASEERLSALLKLRWLDLSDNPIGSVPALRGASSLRAISLRNTRLSGVPIALLEHPTLEVVDVRDNQITTVSELVLQLHHARLGRLVLHDNPLTADAVRRLSSFTRQVSRPAHAALEASARNIWLSDLAPSELARCSQVWQRLVEDESQNAADFFRFLHDLGRSEEFLARPRYMRQRVWAILDSCEQNSEVRQALFEQVGGARTCADQLLFILSELEIKVLVVRGSAGLSAEKAEARMLRLGRSLYRLEQVDRIAAEHVREVQAFNPTEAVDEVEVYLAYRIGLAEPLGLPAQPAYMHYQHFSQVNRADLRDARAMVLARENSQVLCDSLASRDFWKDYLRTAYAERFEAFDTPYHERLSTLEEQAASGTDQRYLEQVDALRAERALAERRFILELTRQAHTRHLA
ncbi:NEL-type E3 ubiquitin ligase domain-containing protein [Pseudomonas putida]|uniref:RING-type E3 ubiquitin transferase n=1 Tax=Pseudomonas putida TaxID=303 RepID=A0A6I6XL24_PSEPU|nr:NEL-type E3 ubiquitin ligase domain-containing protein [Pseudomonas putida]QHG66396.1 hypothetical protein C2H86_19170 [Pseudomonas putida]